MKKFFKITGIVVGVLMALLLILPFALQGKIEDIVKKQGNALLNAQFDFESLDISLLRNFPSASVSLHNFWLKGEGEFANDTLLQAGEVTAAVNVMSLFGDSGFDIHRIIVDDTQVKAIVLKDGKVNWEVMKDSGEEKQDAEESAADDAFRIKLENLKVDGLTVVYDDRRSGIYAQVKDMAAECSGDFGSERSLLDMVAEIKSLTFRSGGIALLNQARIEAEMKVDADLVHNKFVLKENELKVNAIGLNVDGWVALLEDGWDMDLKANTNDVGFKEILSIVPAIYTKDFEGLKTDGIVTLEAFAKGRLKGTETVPEFGLDMKVKEAMFHYPSLPAGVERINIGMKIKNPGGDADLTTIDINPFNFSIEGNPFGLTAALTTPMSDPHFGLEAKGRLDLAKIKDVYPLEDMQLNGLLDADVKVEGKMSYIEKELYDKINATGSIRLNGMKLRLKDMPDIDIKKSTFSFSPRYLELSSTTVNIGNNDLTLDSKFENYIGFALKGSTLKGNLNITSNRLNVNDFLSTDTTTAEKVEATPAAADSVSSGFIKVPANIDFRMNTHLKSVALDNMRFSDVEGLLIVKDGTVDMRNLSMNTMGGNVKVNGMYAAQEHKTPQMKAGFSLKNIVFAQAYNDLGMVRKLAPIFQGLKGDFSGSIDIDTELDEHMSPILATMSGKGHLSTKDLSLSGVKFIDQVADIVKKPSMKDIRVKDLSMDFTVTEGRLATQPFDLKLGDYTMTLSGTTGLDQTIDYTGKITLPASVGGKIRLSTVDMKIGGTFTSPKVSIDMESILKNVAGQAVEELLGGKKTPDHGETGDDGKNILNDVKNLFKKKK